MKVNVLTAVTRPDNLPEIQRSIFAAQELAVHVRVDWHRYTDPERLWVGGQHPKNIMLSRVEGDWVVILDDDTIMHPSFLRRVSRAVAQNPTATAVIVSQRRTTGVVLKAAAENMRVGMVDAGQALLRRDLIGDLYIPEVYAGDGAWLELLLTDNPNVVYLPQVLSLHNALSGIDVSEPPERMQA